MKCQWKTRPGLADECSAVASAVFEVNGEQYHLCATHLETATAMVKRGSRTLEPSDEQLEAACVAMETVDQQAHPTAAGMRATFALIRDMVLEEAKRACERFMDERNAEANKRHQDRLQKSYEECHANGAANCIAILHAMKGKP